MDVDFFLKERTAFIKHYFDEASAPFIETMRKIDAEEPPFEPPYFDPETMPAEPAFQEEWLRAQTGLQVVGQTCVSMLSESLKIFFVTHEKIVGLDCEKSCGEKIFSKGFIKGYRTCFAKHGVDWNQCPVDFSILEQVVLARNASQHATSITSTRAIHNERALRKHLSPLFVSSYEKSLLASRGGSWMMAPTVHVTRDALDAAIDEVEKLAEWLEQD
ncbi:MULTISPECIES: hypothetical protein [unclassified Pseudomonas]|uniref:hypothetical protein n=1 Tax=unclassified Pseudomonas TaxID=196821 RepID=UPI000CD32AC4|nr:MULTISPECIES: hypothetical protein [unclassified Pseudomonas]POA55367.1 hypothetical protein C1889_13465 [Pseudomonas sp. FW507-12TSA]